MKKWMSNLFIFLIFLFGVGIFLYPSISDHWNKLHQSRSIASYEQGVRNLSQRDYSEAWEAARAYNAQITENTFRGDVFSQENPEADDGYRMVLNIDGSGIMGYVSIPKIGEKIPVYHGVSEAVLQIAAGHIQGTRLPIGGAGNHSVIAAHRGLPSAKLFSNLDQMELGDRFYMHVLGEVLAYEVDQILPMVEKEDLEALATAMSLIPEEDHVTLFTCTPYGINTHRMLVRGIRTDYHGEESLPASEGMLTQFNDIYLLLAVLILSGMILLGMLIRAFTRKRRERRHFYET